MLNGRSETLVDDIESLVPVLGGHDALQGTLTTRVNTENGQLRPEMFKVGKRSVGAPHVRLVPVSVTVACMLLEKEVEATGDAVDPLEDLAVLQVCRVGTPSIENVFDNLLEAAMDE